MNLTKRIMFRLTEEEFLLVQKEAKKEERTLSAMSRILVLKNIKKDDK